MAKKGYLLVTTMWNGTVPMQNNYCVCTTKQLAELAKDAVDKANEDNGSVFRVSTCISEIDIYSEINDVPILHEK